MEEVSLQDAAIILVAYYVKSNVRRQLASLLFLTQARYLSERFFLYLHFAERMMPWSSGCIIDEALGQHGELDVGVLSNLVAGSIVTNIQYVMI